MHLPTIHLNGTSVEDLLQQNLNVLTSLQAAIEAMAEAAPHGRDYYPQGDDAIAAARAEYDKRMSTLREMFDEQMKLQEHLLQHSK